MFSTPMQYAGAATAPFADAYPTVMEPCMYGWRAQK